MRCCTLFPTVPNEGSTWLHDALRETPWQSAPPPAEQLTQRGLRTRSALIDGAAKVFARDGFLDARITDICKAAGVAYGTFYTYFTSKEEIFHEVIMSLQEDMAGHEPTATPVEGVTPWDLVEAANRGTCAPTSATRS